MPRKKQPKIKIPEKENMKAIRELLEWKGWTVIRLNTGQFVVGEGKNKRYIKTGTLGLPDLLALKPGYVPLFVEVKGTGGKLSENQKRMIDLINKTTARATVVWSADELVDYLFALDEEMGIRPE